MPPVRGRVCRVRLVDDLAVAVAFAAASPQARRARHLPIRPASRREDAYAATRPRGDVGETSPEPADRSPASSAWCRRLPLQASWPLTSPGLGRRVQLPISTIKSSTDDRFRVDAEVFVEVVDIAD